MTPKTLKQLERAAMRWFRKFDPSIDYDGSPLLWSEDHALKRACARHAAATKKRRK